MRMYFDVKKPEMTNKTFRLPPDLLERLGSIAQQKGVSVNYSVCQCCEYALANLQGGSISQETISMGSIAK